MSFDWLDDFDAAKSRRYPMSFGQQRLWVLWQLDSADPSYNVPAALRLRGPLDRGALEGALRAVVARHEVLRTRLADESGDLVQIVEEAVELPLPFVDLAALERDTRAMETRARAQAFAAEPFDLTEALKLRATLLRVGEQEHVLLICMHHAASDGWSVSVLIREVGELYAANLSDREPRLPELSLQYADFAVWQRNRLDGKELARHLGYWKGRLDGAPRVLELPTDRPRPNAKTGRGGSVPVSLGVQLSEQLRSFAQNEGATPYMVLLAAWSASLARYGSAEEVVVGSPIAGRRRAELETLIGFFVNTLALRVAIGGRPSFRELLGRVRATTLDAYDHQDLPFERLVGSLDLPRDTAVAPVFQVMLTLQNNPETTLELQGLSIELMDFGTSTSKVDLSMTLAETTGGDFAGTLEYDSDLFDRDTIERLSAAFTHLLGDAMTRPEEAVGDLELVDRAALAIELDALRGRTVAPESGQTLQGWFERQTDQTPDSNALLFGADTMTYRELEERANGVAHALVADGLRAGEPVGLYSKRSFEMVIGVLGILKAGGAYVPLEPTQPPQRLRYQLECARASRIVVAAVEPTSWLQDFAVLHVDIRLGRSDRVSRSVAPESPCYILFTSGSTGRPKGVTVPQSAAVGYLRWATDFFPRRPRTLLHTSLTFDATLTSLFLPLLNGAELLLANESYGVEELVDTLVFSTTPLFVGATPTHLRAVLHASVGEAVLLCHVFNIGGEELPTELVRAWFQFAPHSQVFNQYGPTETTVGCTIAEMRPGALVTVGQPTWNTEIYVLDGRGRRLPIGVAGEIYVGGRQVASGYAGQPVMTGESFLPDPFKTIPGGRMYRTGDIGRWLANGDLQCLGRADSQVKLRGFRIELGEIETVIREHGDLRDLVVVVREDRPGDRRLVAYISGDAVDTAGLRSATQSRLPAYMVPSAWVVMETLPLTVSGKIDRRALPMPDAESEEEYEPPRSAAEHALAAIFGELLGVDRVGRTDDFFLLGGHSLLAMRLVAIVRDRLGSELPLRVVFDSSTVGDLASRLGTVTRMPAVVPVSRDTPLVASWAQERMWVLDHLAPGSSAYNMPAALRLRGTVDPEALAAALQAVVTRHEVLRTRLLDQRGRLVQVVEADVEFPLPVFDLSLLSPREQNLAVISHLSSVSGGAFDLTAPLKVRAALLCLGAEEYVLLFVMHHAASDGGSQAVLVAEFCEHYAAGVAGRAPNLPVLPVQYGDYAAWQRNWLGGGELERQLDYWTETLEDAPAELGLPTDHQRPRLKSDAGRTVKLALGTQVSDDMRSLARAEGATPFMVLLAAWSAVLGRYARTDDVVVGSPVAGRRAAELHGLIGLFVNTLAMRMRLAGRPTFRELVRRARETTLAAYEHEDLPFEKLVANLDLPRDTSVTPVFQVMLTLENNPETRLELPGLRIEPIEVESTTSKFDLSLSLSEAADGRFSGSLEYDTDLFDGATAEAIANAFEHFLADALARPDVPASELALVDEVELETQLESLAPGPVEIDFGGSLSGRFEAQVDETPDAIALVYEGTTLSYRELDQRVNALAHALVSRGAAPGDVVGLYGVRSLELVIGMLGIVKAGGAYTPLEPAYPDERLRYQVETAGCRYVVTAATMAPTWLAELEVLSVDIAGSRRERPGCTTNGASTAYVLFTSGSTGRPKGVAVPHRAVLNLVGWTQETRGLGATDVVLQKTPFVFDVSVTELLCPLLVGSRLAIAKPGGHREPRYLGDIIRREGVTTVDFVPSMLALFLDEGVAAELPSLRHITLGGEALPPALARRLGDAAPAGARLWNMYGPTETTVEVTAHEVDPRDVERSVPIGKAGPNTSAHVVDAELRLVPVGVPGELLVGGVQVADGYVGQPRMTAERFVPDVMGGARGGRLYRTGDLVRRRRDGALEFLGRLDAQVKLRGFRIETGEVESVLRAQGEVREATVMVREDRPGDKRLVAYVVPVAVDGGPLDASSLEAKLSLRLPEYMVPRVWVKLDELPLMTSGKVNRRALPVPTVSSAVAYEKPETEAERVVAAIYAELLGVEQVGRQDDFFALGGHSLLAMRLVSMVQDRLDLELALRDVFGGGTVAEVSRRLGAERRVPRIERVARDGHLLPSWSQERLWVLDRLSPESTAYHMSAAIRLVGRVDVEALGAALGGVVSRHEVLRTRLVEVDGQPVQVVEPDATLVMPVIDLRGLGAEAQQEAVRGRVSSFAKEPFDLSAALKLRASLLQTGAEEYVLLFVLHHVASDGWSIGILVDEIAEFYSAQASAREPALEPLPIQYADYAAWQRQWFGGGELERQLSYWRQQLEDAPAVLELPTDSPRPKMKGERGGSIAVSLTKDVGSAVHDLAHEGGATPFMVLLAAWAWVLSRYARCGDVVVGSPTAGRRAAELDGLIGFFVNTLALRVDTRDRPTFRELLRRTKDTTLAAYEHQDVPFEKLVAELDVPRNTSVTPLFQVMFVLRDTPGGVVHLPGVVLESLDLAASTSKFDMTLSLAREDSGEYSGSLVYDAALFESTTVEAVGAQFSRLVADAMRSPDCELACLSPIDLTEARAPAAHKTDRMAPLDGCLHELFARSVRDSPERTAVVSADRRLTYAELDGRARAVGAALHRAGVVADDIVGLLLERGPDHPGVVIAAWRLGAAYVALDPSWPASRMEQVLDDAGVRVVVGNSSLLDGDVLAGRTVIELESVGSDVSSSGNAVPSCVPYSGRLAYVSYTSGSTGRPKGVAVEHRQVTAYLAGWADAAGLSPGMSYASVSTVAADLGNTAIFYSLCTGGELHLVVEEVSRDPERMAEYLRRHPVDVLKLVPTHMRMLLSGPAAPAFPQTHLVLAGEAFSSDLAAEIRGAAPECEVFNCYGPTETTISVCAGPATELGGVTVPLGTMASGTRGYVLDGDLRPVPRGVPGELCLGGGQVSRGYVGAGALTAESFVPDPFEVGERMYRTGDLVRLRHDGALEFLGRSDSQLKIRGYRVEPGEVEAALRLHPGVTDCVVRLDPDRSDDPGLVAYVAGEFSSERRAQLMADVRAELPDYMVPRGYAWLSALPMTANGKLDRKALPEPEREQAAYEAPRNETERVVAAIYEELLGVTGVGRTDDFFVLGGHSLLAMRLVAMVRARLESELALRDVFGGPTVAEVSGCLGGERQVPPVVAVSREGNLPASWSQERMWVLDRLSPGSSAYNVPAALRLYGKVDLEAMRGALQGVVARHEVLRTRLVEDRGQLVQVIDSEVQLPLAVIDLSALGPGARDDAVLSHATEVSNGAFDLGAALKARAALLRLGPEEHVLLFVMHHAASDGWSRAVLVEEFRELYAAGAARRAPSLPDLPVQYGDYAAWQRAWLGGGELKRQLEYWSDTLADAPTVLELPTDRHRPKMKSDAGHTVDLALGAQVSDALRSLARAEGATPFMVLLAAWSAVLGRYGRADDVVVGSPVAGRRAAELHGLIGLFVNTLPMRMRLVGRPSFRELVGRARETTLAAYEHEDLPFEKLVASLDVPRDTSVTPVFQVMLALQNNPPVSLEMEGLRIEPIEVESTTSKFDLSLTLSEGADGRFAGSLEYDTDILDGATAEAIADGFGHFVADALTRPDVPTLDLSLVEEAELETQLASLAPAHAEVDLAGTLSGRFEAQVDETPDALALVYEGATLSYRELDGRANALAHSLVARGVGPGDVVGLYGERSLELVIGVLGILKAGAAYTPLEPTYPEERLRYQLETAGCRHVVAAATTALAGLSELDVFSVEVTASRGDRHGCTTAGTSTAYVLFTSGSTGRPKGVAVPHRAVLNLLGWTKATRGLGATDVVLQKTPFVFDVSVTELLCPLLAGARLVIAKPGGHREPRYLAEIIRKEGVTTVDFVPSMLGLFLDGAAAADLASLRHITLGGEALPPEVARRLADVVPAGTRLWNMYGPTETAVEVTAYELDPGAVGRSVPIGKAGPNTSVHVVDAEFRRVPVGVPGELVVGGVQLADGYMAQPRMTAECFVPDPMSGTAGARLYRTGDLVRWRRDGALEFLGRVDAQVKLRGFRIETGEVESVLRTQVEVREATVMVREDRPGDKRLVAYVVPVAVDGDTLDTAALEAKLGLRLPEYMVPRVWVNLDELPLMTSGKVNRRALPVPTVSSAVAYEEPKTETERLVAAIYAELLGVERVGRQDDFFALGGHSLLAMRLVSLVQAQSGMEMPVRTVFEDPRVSALAATIESAMDAELGGVDARLSGVSAEDIDSMTAEELDALLGLETQDD